MTELYELRDKLCRELKKYNNEDVNVNNLPHIDTLAHAIKNVDKIIEKNEEEDNSSYGYNYGRNGRGSSYSRGRGRNARRDSMGRYSRGSDVIESLKEMMMDAPSEEARRDYERAINRMESGM